MDLITVFLTGLLTGGLSCLAVQGGLLATVVAQREDEAIKEKKRCSVFPILAFLLAKLIAYTILGFFLGLFGSFFQLSVSARIILQIVIVLFMLGSALNLLEVHPIFRYFVIQPPRFLLRKTRETSKNKDLFAPLILGAFTIFIPCGTTQAMMALAVGSGNAITGLLTMFAFILGTIPLFFVLGYFTTQLGESLHKKFLKLAAIGIIILAIFTLNQALTLAGSNVSLNNITPKINSNQKFSMPTKTEYTINISDDGYNPSQINVKAGSHVVLTLVNKEARGCIQSFVIPKLNIQTVVRTGTTQTIEFDAPNSPDQLLFTCSMGMYRGTINIVD